MKCFFALRLQESLRNRLEQLSLRMQEWDLPARWVHPHDVHITLAYLGECAEDEMGALLYNVDMFLSSQQCPQLSIPKLGAFAGKKWPRVIYAAVEDQEHFCADLHRDLAEACDIQVESDYAPHITLCRPQGRGIDRSWEELLAAFVQFEAPVLDVADIVLYQSRTDLQPHYYEIKSWSFLKGQPNKLCI